MWLISTAGSGFAPSYALCTDNREPWENLKPTQTLQCIVFGFGMVFRLGLLLGLPKRYYIAVSPMDLEMQLLISTSGSERAKFEMLYFS